MLYFKISPACFIFSSQESDKRLPVGRVSVPRRQKAKGALKGRLRASSCQGSGRCCIRLVQQGSSWKVLGSCHLTGSHLHRLALRLDERSAPPTGTLSKEGLFKITVQHYFLLTCIGILKMSRLPLPTGGDSKLRRWCLCTPVLRSRRAASSMNFQGL